MANTRTHQIVPREPTPEMIEAGTEAARDYHYPFDGDPEAGAIAAYKAMVAAAEALESAISDKPTPEEIAFDRARLMNLVVERLGELPTINVTELVGLRAENARLRARVAELEEELESERDAAFYAAKEAGLRD